MLVSESFLRDILRLLIWYPFRWIIRGLPVRTSFGLFRFLGRVHSLLPSKGQAHIVRNISHAFPDLTKDEIHDHVVTYYKNHYLDRLHIFTYPKLITRNQIDQVIRIEGSEHLESALEAKKGAIVLIGHYGPIQLPLFSLGCAGYRIIQIGLPTDDGRSWIGKHVAFRLRRHFEAMIPARIISAEQFLRPVFKHLSDNGIIMMNIDPAGGGRWIGRMEPLPFFGQLLPFPLGSILLAKKTGAPILPLTLSIDSHHHFVGTIHPAQIDPPIDLQSLVRDYEIHIRSNPGMWHFWDEFETGRLILDEMSAQQMRRST